MRFAMRRRVAPVLFVLVQIFSFHGFCTSDRAPNYTFVKNATAAPPVSFYDYIIVGGGAAGCPLAATLSKKFRVLLLERGGTPYGNPNIANLVHFADTLSDLSPDSPSQLFFSEDGVANARARVLGGGTSINAGFYSRAAASYVRAAGWDAALADRSYRWVERALVHKPPVWQWQSALLGGLLEAGVGPYNGFTFDHVPGSKVGGTTFDREGRRSTAADLLRKADPARLTVLLWATAQRVLFRHRGRARPAAHGVLFRDKAGGVHRAYLAGEGSDGKNEVILAAGALGSPQLLMLSGVGPAEHLREMGLRVVVDQPMVGRGMADNPMNGVLVPSPKAVEVSLIQVVGITPFGNYIAGGSGVNFLTAVAGVAGGLQKFPASAVGNLGMLSSNQAGQPAGYPPQQGTPLEETAAAAAAAEVTKALRNGTFRGGYIIEEIMGPLSRGHLQLTNLDPGDTPRVTFNYFQEPEDLRRCVEGLRTIEGVIQSRAFAEFRYPGVSVAALLNTTAGFPLNLRPRHDNVSASLEQYCQDTVVTIYHYHGGCLVGQVVDSEYRVAGVDALRVVDASTFHNSPGTNPQATVMMLGRYMGIKIQEQRLGRTGD